MRLIHTLVIAAWLSTATVQGQQQSDQFATSYQNQQGSSNTTHQGDMLRGNVFSAADPNAARFAANLEGIRLLLGEWRVDRQLVNYDWNYPYDGAPELFNQFVRKNRGLSNYWECLEMRDNPGHYYMQKVGRDGNLLPEGTLRSHDPDLGVQNRMEAQLRVNGSQISYSGRENWVGLQPFLTVFCWYESKVTLDIRLSDDANQFDGIEANTLTGDPRERFARETRVRADRGHLVYRVHGWRVRTTNIAPAG